MRRPPFSLVGETQFRLHAGSLYFVAGRALVFAEVEGREFKGLLAGGGPETRGCVVEIDGGFGKVAHRAAGVCKEADAAEDPGERLDFGAKGCEYGAPSIELVDDDEQGTGVGIIAHVAKTGRIKFARIDLHAVHVDGPATHEYFGT